jgi:HK97 family phage prohead protease
MTIHRHMTFAMRAANEATREADIIASTGEIDAYGERVDPAGIDLTRYAQNPVVLFGHNSYGLPIGHSRNVRVDGDALRATVRFVDASANELAERVYQGVLQKSIRGVSIGFRSKSSRVEEIDGRSVPVHTAVELVEISIVTLPANPSAVVTDARALDPSRKEHQMKKQWHEMTFAEKHALWVSDETQARALREAPATFKGKTWDAMTNDEKAACYREDRPAFLAMQGGG